MIHTHANPRCPQAYNLSTINFKILIYSRVFDLPYTDDTPFQPHPFNPTLSTAVDEFNKSVELSCSGDTDSVNSNNSKKTRLYVDTGMQGQGQGQGQGRSQEDRAAAMMRAGGGDQVRG